MLFHKQNLCHVVSNKLRMWSLIQIVCLFTTGSKPSWTAKLAGNQELLCSKIREEAGELCETLEQQEGPQRAASEMADLLYHSMVLLNVQVPPIALLFCVQQQDPC